MVIRISIMSFVVLSYILISGCCVFNKSNSSNELSEMVKGADLVLTGEDDKESFSVNLGNELIVQLESNPTTGYVWEIIEGDDEILSLIKKSYKQREAEEGMVGVGGTDYFLFKASKKGSTTIRLEYKRPFETAGDIAKSFQFEITVE